MAAVFLFFFSSIFLDGPAEVFSYVLFIVVLGACHMPRTSEIMETADLKKYEKSCSSITKSLTSPPSQFPLPPNLAGFWLTIGRSNLWSQKTHWSSGLAKSRGKLTPLYLQHHNVNPYQTWQDGDLPWEASTHKLKRLVDHVVL